ncbi:permease-like cell division protein FtsX [Desulfitobacterium sp.]|uniref:permease-like cell division protein FtsX n=1 Tax=Desulfitobacterium sp. TaxID=49981 RepID=UPI002B215A57|nr:permease-like cell division protein FtsX [Desulfitobacterium sp.]MEA4900993.1 permease-like cell division protein FtsX [Desulfitobacterium sp.]
MSINSLKYMVQVVFKSIRRNFWLSLASVLTVMVALVILGASAFFFLNANNMAKDFESQVEIAVFADDNVSRDDIQKLQKQVEGLSGVASVELTPKEKVLNDFSQSMGSSNLVSDLGGTNPFPDKLSVQVTDPQQVQEVADQIKTLKGVGKVRYGQGVVDQLLNFTHWLRWIGIGIVIAFAAASLVLISLNIKMNVFSRRREIQIMKLVGASNWFIRGPFLIEGMFLGFLGGLLAILIVGFGYQWLAGYISSSLTFMPIVQDAGMIAQVLAMIILAGMAIGAIGSVISLRKFLKV